MLAVSGLTLVATGVVAIRRRELSPEERFTVWYREWVATGHAELFELETQADDPLNVLLVVSLVLAVSSVGYAVAVPKQGKSFSEFYLLPRSRWEVGRGRVPDGVHSR